MQVSWARLGDAHEGLPRLLDPVERGRYDATVRPDDRARFLVGCALSRLLLGELLGLAPADVPLRRVCPRCGGPHGKVRLDIPDSPAPYDFSVTHSGSVVGVALCRGGRMGLDVEETGGPVDVDSAARAALSARELTALTALTALPPAGRQPAFLRVWTRKEAVLKALGLGLTVSPRELEVTAPGLPPAVLSWPGQPAVPPVSGLADLVVDGTHPAAVAVTGTTVRAGAGRVRVEQRDASRLLAGYGR